LLVIWTSEKPEARDHFYFVPTDVDRDMSSTTLPEVDDYLLAFADISEEIVIAH